MADGLDEVRRVLHIIDSTFRSGFTNEQWRTTVEYLESIHRSYFDTATGPSGDQWAPLSPKTVLKKGHDTILVDSEELVRSVTDSSAPSAVRLMDSTSLEFGTSREFAGVHQDGSSNVPQREFLGINDEALGEIENLIGDAVMHFLDQQLAF